MSLRFRICLTAWIAIVLLTAFSANGFAQTLEFAPVPAANPSPQQAAVPVELMPVADSDWVIDIRPAAKVVSMPSQQQHVVVDQEQPCEACGTAQTNDYAKVYSSIPFNRSEYNVNPSYRHDSAMEIMTGNARHQTILRHSTVPPAPVVQRPVVANGVRNPYSYGYLRPALRLNYYRYFPSLNPYVNMWNLSGAY